jgi:tRNA pseudouridine13 synthase
MRYKVRPEDFVVEEQVQLPLTRGGPFRVYRVTKRGATTLSVRASIARALGLRGADVAFPAIKDKVAVAVQHTSVRGPGPARLSGNGFEAQLVGCCSRPLTARDVTGNRFQVVLRDLSRAEPSQIKLRLEEVRQHGLPNYFDQQRFGSLPYRGEPIGKRILLRDAEGALRAYLSEPFIGDPAEVKRFKRAGAEHWGDWERLFAAAPRPSNFRSVLTYLRDHPSGDAEAQARICRKAINLITRRLLSLYLAAYQSLLWNRIAGRWLVRWVGDVPYWLEVARERLPLHSTLPVELPRGVSVALPSHRARYGRQELASIVEEVLAEERLGLHDLKARVLDKAYLSKGTRTLLLFPDKVSASLASPDQRFQGKSKMTVEFTLPRGSYATLVLKSLVL